MYTLSDLLAKLLCTLVMMHGSIEWLEASEARKPAPLADRIRGFYALVCTRVVVDWFRACGLFQECAGLSPLVIECVGTCAILTESATGNVYQDTLSFNETRIETLAARGRPRRARWRRGAYRSSCRRRPPSSRTFSTHDIPRLRTQRSDFARALRETRVSAGLVVQASSSEPSSHEVRCVLIKDSPTAHTSETRARERVLKGGRRCSVFFKILRACLLELPFLFEKRVGDAQSVQRHRGPPLLRRGDAELGARTASCAMCVS